MPPYYDKIVKIAIHEKQNNCPYTLDCVTQLQKKSFKYDYATLFVLSQKIISCKTYNY